jgi:hypothetical protein
MTETFEINTSRTQLVLLTLGYCVIGLVALIYIDDLIFKSGCSLLCVLLGLSECSRLRSQEAIQLELNSNESTICLKQNGQPYFYHKNKVYPTRWFAILRLVGEPKIRTLFLNSDRFKSVQNYQAIRYSLVQMERMSNVA